VARSKTPSFVLEIGLIVDSKSDAELLSRFQAGRQLYNACLSEAVRRMDKLRKSAEYLSAKHLPLKSKQRSVAFTNARAQYRFTDYDLQAFANVTANRSVWIAQKIDSNSVQTLATRAFKAAERLLFGKARKVRYKVPNRFNSIENKTNKQGLRWKDNCLVWGKLKLQARIDWENPVQLHGLAAPIKYCRLLKRDLNGKRRWFVQIVLEGKPFQKPHHQVSDGLVGLDLNVSNVAFVANKRAGLLPFADKVLTFEGEIKAISRQMQRSQRHNNPNNYEPDFTLAKGRKTVKKNRKLVNEILRHGKHIKTEKVSVKGWQKRYGKAIAAKSPGYFQSELKRKAESAGGSFVQFSTSTTALSQTHLNGERIKKSLSERVHYDQTGVVMHRDLFSAYLSRFVTDNMLDVQVAQDSYYGSESILTAAWQAYQSSKRVGESESPQSQSPVERMAVKLGKVDQIASCGRQVNPDS
jgi:hypothetical protein